MFLASVAYSVNSASAESVVGSAASPLRQGLGLIGFYEIVHVLVHSVFIPHLLIVIRRESMDRDRESSYMNEHSSLGLTDTT